MRGLALAAVGCACAALAAPGGNIVPFSAVRPGDPLPAGWRALTLPRIPAPEVTLVADGGVTVLRSRAAAAGGTVAFALDASPAERPILSWR